MPTSNRCLRALCLTALPPAPVFAAGAVFPTVTVSVSVFPTVAVAVMMRNNHRHGMNNHRRRPNDYGCGPNDHRRRRDHHDRLRGRSPTTVIKDPLPAVLGPAWLNPHLPGPGRMPKMSGHPNMPATTPLPVSGNPDVRRRGCHGHHLDLRRGRRNHHPHHLGRRIV